MAPFMSFPSLPYLLTLALTALSLANAACTPNTTSTTDLQSALTSGGTGYTLSLCANQIYTLTQVLNYTAANQEISTEGYPRDGSRAVLLIGGFNQTTAVKASDANLDGVALRNIQINGNRGDEAIYTAPNANIEFGGDNSNQLIEFVRSYDPRGWSCMHIAEGPFRCSNATIQYNDIGPCGSQSFQQWSDGISLSCQSSLVQGNTIVDPTDGGIVIFGSPYSTIRNNTISVKTRTALGGINMVDPVPWQPEGNFTGVVVEDNRIHGGYATGFGNDTLGTNNASAIIKIGIAIGPRTWFSDDRYGTNQTWGATVQNNVLSGAFTYGIGIAGARDFVIQNNSFTGNVSFIGSYGPNCTTASLTPNPPVPLLQESERNTNLTISVPAPPQNILQAYSDSGDFVNGTGNGLTCLLPPDTNTFAWPYGDDGVNAASTTTTAGSTGGSPTSGSGSGASGSSSPAASSTGAASRVELNLGAAIGLALLLCSAVAGGTLI